MPGDTITERPDDSRFVQFAPGFAPRFLVTVDAEEEFDWSAPFSRSGYTTDSLPQLRRFLGFCEEFGVIPVFLADYPVASATLAGEVLGEAARAGRCEIGMQLHPWVNPPHDEDVNLHNSFAGNLAPDLERRKIRKLRAAIEQTFGVSPVIYRAGRYGAGAFTAGHLRESGIAMDTSVRSNFDYSYAGGPNYRDHPLKPYWLDEGRSLMELPLTTIFWGPLRRQAGWLYPHLWRAPRLRGAMAKAGLLERIPLTPEGTTVDECIRGIDIALDDGLPLLVFSFHSPSLAPGYTPYVRNEEDLEGFYAWWRAVLAYLARRGVRPASASQVMAAAELA